MKKILSVSIIALSLLALGGKLTTDRHELVGGRMMTVSATDTGATIAIDRQKIVELRSDSQNAYTLVVHGGAGECLLVSFKNGESEPYQVVRTIRGPAASTVLIYDAAGTVASSATIPR